MTSYARHKERAAARQRTQSLTGRDIAPLPPIANPKRRAAAAKSFKIFCETYFPETFSLPWSRDHLKVIEKIEIAVQKGGLFAVAMPRASGKTSLCKTACLWATLYGHRNFVALIGPSESHAQQLLHDLKKQLETNPLLAADFPEVCYPIRKLDGIANRCAGQLYLGQRTHIEWTTNKIVLPTIPGSPASGAIMTVAGLTGQIRGMTHQRPDGHIARPNLVIIDDPQTDESARSPTQCATRESIITGAILGLAGPNKKIAAIMPCTVITRGDLADTLLDREKHPEWQGERLKLVYQWPTREDLWEQYAQIRAESLRAGHRGEEATEFYRKHRKEMDHGAIVAWPERFNDDELSAIQYAYNLKLQDPIAFAAEYQNEPITNDNNSTAGLATTHVTERINHRPRFIAPAEATTLTAFIDIHANLLYYAVAAWAPGFTGWIIDYGTYPPQPKPYYTAATAHPTLQSLFPNLSLEARIYKALTTLIDQLAAPWKQEPDTYIMPAKILIDAGWGQTTEMIFTLCRENPHHAILMPSFGRYISASATPMSEYRKKPGERTGWNWRIPPPSPGRATRHVLFDANAWKTFLIQRLQTPQGQTGAITLFGTTPALHRLLQDHLQAEQPIETTARGRTIWEWKQLPHKPDNHLFDCLVGCAVAAAISGIESPQTSTTSKRRKIDLKTLTNAR